MGGKALDRPVVAKVATPNDRGLWLVASDGAVVISVDAGFSGSMGGRPVRSSIVLIDAP